MSAMEATYVSHKGKGGRTISTDVYRDGLALSLYSRCKLFPSDSAYYDLRASRCGVPSSVIVSIARLFLEEARGSRYLPSLFMEGRWRWLDLPNGEGCGP